MVIVDIDQINADFCKVFSGALALWQIGGCILLQLNMTSKKKRDFKATVCRI